MTAPVALGVAVEEARKAQRLYDSCPAEAKGNCVTCTPRLHSALRSLLAALDAVGCVPGVICPTCLALEEAEDVIREIADAVCRRTVFRENDPVAKRCPDLNIPGVIWCPSCKARRYFARRDKLEVPE